jgi:uncharacterized damage-inducible protein DinB
MSDAQTLFVIGPREGYAPRIGVLVSQLINARHYLLRAARNLSPEDLDAPPGAARNTIGAILAHLDAAENMFQRTTFEGRRFNDEEAARYGPYFEFEGGERSRGRTLSAYFADLQETRERTLQGMRLQEDAWLDTPKTFMGQPANIFYHWFHYIQDEARHTGQIILIRKHLMKGANPEFYPYSLKD